MSSDMKDARWQLALGYAEEDGNEWDKLDYKYHEAYLQSAQAFLDKHGTRGIIEALAAQFRGNS